MRKKEAEAQKKVDQKRGKANRIGVEVFDGYSYHLYYLVVIAISGISY
jgi:hypothetical protein